MSCSLIHLLNEPYLALRHVVVKRVRIAGQVLPENFLKFTLPRLALFLISSKRCSSRSDHQLCLLVLEHPLPPLLGSRSLSLKPPLTTYSLVMQGPRHLWLCYPGPGYALHLRGYGLHLLQASQSFRRTRAVVTYAG